MPGMVTNTPAPTIMVTFRAVACHSPRPRTNSGSRSPPAIAAPFSPWSACAGGPNVLVYAPSRAGRDVRGGSAPSSDKENVVKHGTICWHEVYTPDADKVKPFYSQLFGWGTKETQAGPFPYTMFTHDG